MKIKLSHTTYKQCKDEIIKFRNLNRDDFKNEEYFNWRYLDRPHNSVPIVILAKNGKDELIGSLSIIPHHFSINNETKYIGVIGDISVKKQFRRKGIAKKMFNYIKEIEEVKKFEYCIVLPNYEASIPLQKAGWTNVSSVQKFVKVIDINYFLKDKIKFTFLRKVIMNIGNKIMKVIFFESNLPEEYTYKTTNSLNNDFDVLWNSIDKNNLIIGYRNKAYLEWRYSNHPLVRYKIFSLYKNSILLSYIIFHRVNKRILQIDDLLCLDFKNNLKHLFLAFIKYIKDESKTELIYFRVNDNYLIKNKLKRYGFIKRKDCQKFMVYYTDGADVDLKKGKNWFITASDKDT